MDYPNIPDDLKDRMKQTGLLIKKELDFLLDCISIPQYNAEH